ncbi:MAG TPA: phosphoenolpyruvate--protein phosphotransferase [Fibrobacteria bacterium]|nr:phosphoenolpyruvate--protein phosphotransferase [Fibrobacteria bacterium]
MEVPSRSLSLLSDFARVLSRAQGIGEIATHVVRLVSEHLGGDQCNLYFSDPETSVLTLAATSSTSRTVDVRLELGEGLTGMVAQTSESLNVANGPRTPGFRRFAQLQEDKLLSYLGVPLVARGRCNGVIVVRSPREEVQPPETEMLLVALASQLSAVLESARLLDALEQGTGERERQLRILDSEPGDRGSSGTGFVPRGEMQVLRGFTAAPGMMLGPAYCHGRIVERDQLVAIASLGPDEEKASFDRALEKSLDEIHRCEATAVELVGQELSYLFGAQTLLLNDPVFRNGVFQRIGTGQSAALAIHDSVEHLVGVMRQAKSDYLRERAADFGDIGRMLVGKLLGESTAETDPRGSIVFAHALSPGDLVLLASRGAKAFVIGEGGITSHVSLMSRALNLPAITGVGGAVTEVEQGSQILVDAVVGNVFVHPTNAVLEEYRKVSEIEEARVEVGEDRSLLGPCQLASGEYIQICANVGLLREIPVARRRGADGIGLYRTEFPYLMRRDAPTEAQQVAVYQKAFEDFPDRSITFRTLDLGGDKIAQFLHNEQESRELEDNPFLGQRSIRLSLAHPELFRTQLRALLRACEGKKGRILFPMISAVDEMKEVLRQVDLARAELRSRGTPFNEEIDIGAMIEVPAAVEIAGHLSRLVDYLSVGTNDLLQYTVAADRGNRKVAELASNYHPALFSLLGRLAWEATKAGLPVSVCGEMAADPACALYLAGIQVDVLSMDSRYIPRTKVLLRGYTLPELKEIAGGARKLATASEVNRYLHQNLRVPPEAERLFAGAR